MKCEQRGPVGGMEAIPCSGFDSRKGTWSMAISQAQKQDITLIFFFFAHRFLLYPPVS